MPVVTGIQAVKDALAEAAAKQREVESTCVVVGYTANYALWVHEAVEEKLRGLPRGGGRGKGFYWDPQGQAQAKFLETPAREHASDMGRIVSNAVAKGMTLLQALGLAGSYLQARSMELVPVDTGNLKNSAFTREEPLDEELSGE